MGGRSLVALAVALQACSYITQREFEEKRDAVDEDKDGDPWSSDCDDRDADRSTKFDEIPYDGIDNNCDAVDVVDMDGDGFPGVIDADYEALEPKIPFPPNLIGKPLDCLDDPSRPEAATVHPPPNDTELPYDGIDSDCDRSNDFDVDGDGWLAREAVAGGEVVDIFAAYTQYVETWGYEGEEASWAPPGESAPLLGDCNDFEIEVHPDPTTPDAWYDGVDQDCDDRNDFDQDGDGFMPPLLPDGSPTLNAYNEFISTYHDDNPPWTLPGIVTTPEGVDLDAFSDCLDDPALAPVPVGGSVAVDPADVQPQASQAFDDWYDGIDTNCWADNDFDKDIDAFLPETLEVGGDPIDVVAAYEDYVASWGYEDREEIWGAPGGVDAPRPGDCNDDDPASYPEALELVGDQTDQDCDDQPDAAAFSFAGWIWDRPGPVRAARVGDNYVIAVTAAAVDVGTGLPLEEVGLALSVHLDAARTGVVPVYAQFKASSGDPIGEAVDLAIIPTDKDFSLDGIPDPGAWVGVTYVPVSSGLTYLLGRPVYENSASGAISLGAPIANYPPFAYTPTAIEIAVNSDAEPYIVSCSEDVLQAIQGIVSLPTEPQLIDETPDRGGVCFLNTTPYASGANEIVEYTRCSDTLCNDYSLALSTDLQTAANGNTGELWTGGHTHGALQMLLDGDGLLVRDTAFGVDYPLLDGSSVLSADAVLLDDELFVAAIIDDAGERVVRLTYGPQGDFATLDLPFVGAPVPDPVPEHVALHADGDRVLVAVTARDRTGTPNQDVVGWMFLGTPQ